MRHPALLFTFPLLATLGAGGCVPRPQLAVPPEVLSTDWRWQTPATAASAEADPGTTNQGLAEILGSPALAALIDQAMRSSPGLLAAQARVDQALAGIRIARSAGLPVVSVASSGTARAGSNGGAMNFSSSFGALDAAISIDLAGGIKAGNRAARQRARAAGFDRDAIAVSLAAQIARAYVSRATLEARLALLDRNISDTTKLLRIIEIRQREGVATRVDVGLQIIRVRQLSAERSRLDQALDQTRTALAVLVGAEAPAFSVVATRLQDFAIAPLTVPRPSQLLVVRPDVLAAEARIQAANGDVQQARAAFFPRLDLSISRTAESFVSGGLLSGISIGAGILTPIFGRGRLTGGLNQASAAQRESVQNYRQTLLSAFAEVEDALSAVQHASERAAILAEVEREAALTASLGQQQYLEGDVDLRAVLDAQDLMISAQDARAVSIQEQLEAAIALYRATRQRA